MVQYTKSLLGERCDFDETGRVGRREEESTNMKEATDRSTRDVPTNAQEPSGEDLPFN